MTSWIETNFGPDFKGILNYNIFTFYIIVLVQLVIIHR